MKTESKPVIEYFHRGNECEEIGARKFGQTVVYQLYSANSENGAPFYPWMTRLECIADARAKGAQARFNYGVVAK